MKHCIPCISVLFLIFSAPAWPHGGEAHEHPEDAVAAPSGLPTTASMPRASAASEEFELVAILAENRLTLYLDNYATNAAVADAQIEVESGAFKRIAKQTGPGVHELAGDSFAKPGRYPLVFSIQTDASADLLTTTLEVAPVANAAVETPDHRIAWAAAGALLLAGVGMVWKRRRK